MAVYLVVGLPSERLPFFIEWRTQGILRPYKFSAIGNTAMANQPINLCKGFKSFMSDMQFSVFRLSVLCPGEYHNDQYKPFPPRTREYWELIPPSVIGILSSWESEGSIRADSFFIDVEDLRSVIEYLTGLNRLVAAILGHSRGANIVLLYASKYHDIPAVIQVSACCDFEGVIERPTDDQTTEDMEQFTPNMREACLSIDERCRVLTVHGLADEDVPVEEALKFAKIIPNHTLQFVPGANHLYSSHMPQLASAILPFVKECMQQG